MRMRLYLWILKSSLRGRRLFNTVQGTEGWWRYLQALPQVALSSSSPSCELKPEQGQLHLNSRLRPFSLLPLPSTRTVPHALSTYYLSYTRMGFFHTKIVVNMLTINHSVCVCVCVCVCESLSHVRPCDPWTVAHQAPLSMGFARQEYWSGLPLPSPINHIKRPPGKKKKKKKTSSCWTPSFQFSSIVLKTIHILKCKETGKKELDIKIVRKQFLCVLLREPSVLGIF